MNTAEILNLIAIIVIPIAAVLIGQYLQSQAEKRKDKMQIFKTLMTSRIYGWTVDSVHSDEMKTALCNYFDPYSEQSNNWKEIHCCFVGFDYTLYNSLQGSSDEEIESYFKENYLKRIQSAHKLFAQKVLEHDLKSLEFILLLLPFKSVENFRHEFFQLLGITNFNIEANSDDK